MNNNKKNVNNVMKSFSSGGMCDAYRYFGSRKHGDKTHFSVWAPGADNAFVKISDNCVPMKNSSGVWTADVPGDVGEYRYVFEKDGCFFEKNDPFAFSVSSNHRSESFDICGFSVS